MNVPLDYKQKRLIDREIIELPDFSIVVPQVLKNEVHNLYRSGSSLFSGRILQRALEIAFLPCFKTTNFNFHGKSIDSIDPKDGFATFRPAQISGTNFRLVIIESYDMRGATSIDFIGGCNSGDTVALGVDVTPGHSVSQEEIVEFLDVGILTPIRDELMVIKPLM